MKLPLYVWVIIAGVLMYFVRDSVFWLWVAGFMVAIRVVSGEKQAEDMAFILICLACAIIAVYVLYSMLCAGLSGRGNSRYNDYLY